MRNRSMFVWTLTILIVTAASATVHAAEAGKVLKAGIVGTTTSHVQAFTGAINNPEATGDLAGVKVVAGFTGGIEDNPSSWDRREKYSKYLREQGCTIYDTIEEMMKHVDVVLLESVDGRPHLEQAKPVIAAGKPLFVDKPMAGSLADVIEIFRLAKEAGVPCFSSSSLRYSSEFQAMRNDSPVGAIVGCAAYSPCSLEEHHPDFFWYGVHGMEILYTIMGTGCQTVTRVHTEGTDMAVGVWGGGRIGTFRGIRDGKRGYGATVFGAKGIQACSKYDGYMPLVNEICKFFKTGVAPVSAEETIEMFAFMEAADESKRQGGAPVSIESVIKKAKEAHAKKE
jgi:GFO/IDH/MocA oxidoreductase family protein